MATRRIKLTRYAVENVNLGYYGAWRMRIEASDAEGPDLSNYIFIFERVSPSPYEGSQNCDRFCAVAGPAQMADIPAVDPDPEQNWPFFRSNSIELDFTSQKRADQAWQLIQKEVCILVEGLGKLTQLSAVEEVWCPGPPSDSDGVDSESASESLSESS